jgi:hypothetical protein
MPTARQVGFPSFSAIFDRKMQKLPLFSCILIRNEGENRTALIVGAEQGSLGSVGLLLAAGWAHKQSVVACDLGVIFDSLLVDAGQMPR